MDEDELPTLACIDDEQGSGTEYQSLGQVVEECREIGILEKTIMLCGLILKGFPTWF